MEEQNCLLKARLELLKKGRQDFSGMTEVVEKVRYLLDFSSVFHRIERIIIMNEEYFIESGH